MLKVITETPRFKGKSRYTTIYYVDDNFSGCKMHIGTKIIGYNQEIAYIKSLIHRGGI